MSGSLAIGWCDGGNVTGAFTMSLLGYREFDFANRKLHSAFLRVPGAFIADNRNTILKEFLNRGIPWLLMLDSDVEFSPTAPHALVDEAEARGIKVLSGAYFTTMGKKETFSVVWLKRHKPTPYRLLRADDLDVDEMITEVDAVGMGMCLIHRAVAEAVTASVGDDPRGPFGRMVVADDEGTKHLLGEDLSFCRRAQDLGFRIYGHGGIIGGHHKTRREDEKTFAERVNGAIQPEIHG
jgi:hypothetical protein